MRKVVFKSSTHYYGAEQDDPAFFTEEMGRQHPPRTGARARHRRGRAGGHDFAQRNPDVDVRSCAAPTSSARTSTPRSPRMFSAPGGTDGPGFDPAPVRPRGRRRPRAGARRLPRPPGHLQRRRRRRACAVEVIDCSARSPAPVPAAVGHRARRGSLRRLGFRIPVEVVNQLRFGRGVDNRLFKATGFDYGYTSREAVISFGAHAAAPVMRGTEQSTRTSARSRSSCAGARTCVASTRVSGAAWPRTASRWGFSQVLKAATLSPQRQVLSGGEAAAVVTQLGLRRSSRAGSR